MENDIVRAWKAYAEPGVAGGGPLQALDVQDVVQGGSVVASWQGSFSCCDTTLCSDCSIN
ncbi:hypothetical protein RVR_37 [Actinacidiphila reveromycinica]|uniref:Uncharacterized protein n=1 Tax=Actinacidiphila reveromycinica TaxID=659352 RepID=A0A7U3UMH3_9ACTN|nr:hypothetical protein [Streptomyces sp. SN-593]BBA95249.1 hypothetical protein RVR_37 [Streptomyces sp. SN-593]